MDFSGQSPSGMPQPDFALPFFLPLPTDGCRRWNCRSSNTGCPDLQSTHQRPVPRHQAWRQRLKGRCTIFHSAPASRISTRQAKYPFTNRRLSTLDWPGAAVLPGSGTQSSPVATCSIHAVLISIYPFRISIQRPIKHQ